MLIDIPEQSTYGTEIPTSARLEALASALAGCECCGDLNALMQSAPLRALWRRHDARQPAARMVRARYLEITRQHR